MTNIEKVLLCVLWCAAIALAIVGGAYVISGVVVFLNSQ